MAKQTINIGTTANDGTGDPLRTAFDKVNDNFTELYSDDTGDVDSVNGQTVVVTLDTDDIPEGTINFYNAYHTGDVEGSAILTIQDNVVDHDQLAARYTEKQDIATTSWTINLDASSYGIFEFTSALTGATTLNIQNIKKGQVIDILVTGAQTITLADSFTTSTINQAGTGVYDVAASNHIQLTCVDDNYSDAILIYSVATYTSDTYPS